MPRTFSTSTLTLIYAEDDDIFREIAFPEILKVGVAEDRLLCAKDGAEALKLLEGLQNGNTEHAIVMLLDVMMPVMDGHECAEEVRRLADEGKLKRVPVLMCCSSGVEQMAEFRHLYDVTMAKPFSDKDLSVALKTAEEMWASAPGGGGGGGKVAVGGGGQHGGVFDISQVELILGDPEPICRMALMNTLVSLGCNDDMVVECDLVDDICDALKDAGGKTANPLMVFLSKAEWADRVIKTCHGLEKVPFVVCASVEGDQGVAGFNAALPKHFQQSDLEKVMDECKRWWMTN